jgi:hypothetical protein
MAKRADDESARKERAEQLRSAIEKIESGQPAGKPLSPREMTDRAAAEELKRKGDIKKRV